MSKLTIDDLVKQEDEEEIDIGIKEKNPYQELYDLCKSKLGENNLFTLDTLNNLANYYRDLGAHNKALELHEEVYVKRKEILGKNNLDTISALNDLACSYFDLRDYNKAAELQNTVYNTRKVILGESDSDTLKALSNLAVIYSYLGYNDKVLEMKNTAYNALKDNLGEKHPDALIALANLASSYSDLGDYNKAVELQNAVYTARKEILGANHSDTLFALNNLANYYSYLGHYNTALEMRNTVYNTRKEILGTNHPDTLTALANLGLTYSDLGDYKKALETENTAYNARKKFLGETHPDTLTSLSNLANCYSDLGDCNKALEMRKAVYNTRKEKLGEKHADTLSSLSSLATSYSDLGDYNKAYELQNVVYNERKKILGENHPNTLFSLNNLANSYFGLGDYNRALQLQNTAYNALKDILGKNHPVTLSALNNLANFYSNLGDYNTALEMRNAVYNASKETLGENHPDTLSSLINLANSCTNSRDNNKAFKLQTIAYISSKDTLGAKHLNTVTALNNLAYFYSSLGDYNKALEMRNAVYNTRKENLGENHLSTLIALSNLGGAYSDIEDYNKALEIENIAYNALKENLGESHPDTLLALSNLLVSQILQDETDNQSIKKSLNAYFKNINNLKRTAFSIKEVSSRRNFLKSFNEIYELLKSCVFERNIKDLVDYLFINKNLSFEMDVNRFHKEAMGERLSLEEVSHMISNKLVIDFYELDNSKYGLILVKKGKYSQCVVDYEDLISGSFINDEDIKSFIGSLEDYDHIYICPDGNLYNLSFERVLDCLNISYLSSVQTLFKKNTDDDYTDQLVSFVYPDFSGTQSEDNDRGDTKGVLYGSYLEGMFIHDIYGENSTIYSSYQANHDNFLNTKRPRVLHVSTHGDYLDNENMEPMDRGILCLSGYNVEDNNYGYISAKEIQYMDLKGTELAVLSACNTGLGENISGEGIYGIRRAFELAGCQTLLLTVEEVDDFNSAIFMKSFYERYNQTNNVYQSFKDTKEYLKKYGLVELKELRDVFEKEMKNKIKNPFVYTRNINELNNRIEESETIGQIVRKKNNQYIQEDWNGFIIQGKIENA